MTWIESEGAVRFRPIGHLYEGPECDRLEAMLLARLESGTSCVIVDLSEVGLLSARAVGVLARAERAAEERGGSLRIEGVRAPHRWLLEVTGLSSVLALEAGETAGIRRVA